MTNKKDFFKFASILVIITVFGFVGLKVFAEGSDTEVTVSNTVPEFSVVPFENPSSDGTTPTNQGNIVTFTATATDLNTDNYFLIVCSTNSVTPEGGTGNAPSCGATQYCISNVTASSSQATCPYTTQAGDAESLVWYGFVCDDITASSCSTGSQGSGSSGSPLKVNHVPTFSVITDDGGSGADSGADPGGTVTFTATAADSDSDTAQDNVKLVVCADNTGATASACAGTQICISSLAASNPNCTLDVASVQASGNFNYYSYVFDSHDLGSSSNPRSGQYTINNTAPVVSSVTINGGDDISLTADNTTAVVITGTVTDTNSCQDLTSVEGYLYRSGVTQAGCDNNATEGDDNFCYAEITCTIAGGNTCTGASDSSAAYTCTVAVEFFADPTDATTEFTAENWLSSLGATDNGSNTTNTQVSSGVELLSLVAIETDAAINFGALELGEDTGSTNQTLSIRAIGNTGIDVNLLGTDMTFDTFTIPVSNQEYSDNTFTYGSGVDLTASDIELELDITKPITNVGTTKSIFWGISIPLTAGPGTYTGQNTITATKSEVVEW